MMHYYPLLLAKVMGVVLICVRESRHPLHTLTNMTTTPRHTSLPRRRPKQTATGSEGEAVEGM